MKKLNMEIKELNFKELLDVNGGYSGSSGGGSSGSVSGSISVSATGGSSYYRYSTSRSSYSRKSWK